MSVCVIGPGAMGCLFAARLARGGVKTILLDYKPDRAKYLAASGIVVEEDNGQFSVKVNCLTKFPPTCHLVIVLVKSYNTSSLRDLPSCPVLTLQNGLGNAEKLTNLIGSNKILAGATYEAAYLVDVNRVIHTAAGLTRFGAWTTCSTEYAERVLKQAGFSVEITEAPGQTIWEKAIVNSGINPITALLNIPNGGILDIPEARSLMRDLVVEAVKVATSEGYKFPYSMIERTEEICRLTRDNFSSMLQDLRTGRKTEIDAICGEILERAQIAGVPTPRMRVVWQLIKAIEQK